MESLYTGEGGAGRDAVDEDKTLAVAYPLVSECDVFFLAGCIEDFEHARLAVDLHLLAVRVFDGGIVCLNEVVQTELSPVSGRRQGSGRS